jgi:lipoprotein-anchoring transpeptidase ErfK/SrfK
MSHFTRRMLITGVSASAAASLAGCASTNPNSAIQASALPAPQPSSSPAPQSVADEVEPSYHDIYGEIKSEPYPVPAIKLAQIDSAFLRKNISYVTKEAPGTIVIDPANHYLYHVEEGGRATRYGVGVGREGFVWTGEAKINSKQEWPDWYPPKEMLVRRPDMKKMLVGLQSGTGMHGGPGNPLGARAMYLWQGKQDTLFRIHGTIEPWTIGQSVSSGCIRMINQDVMHLYDRTPVGTKVVVLGPSNAQPDKLAKS